MGRYGEIWGDMGRYGEIWGDVKVRSRLPPEDHRAEAKLAVAEHLRGVQSDAIRSDQTPSAAISGHQHRTPSDAIGRHQTPSDAVRNPSKTIRSEQHLPDVEVDAVALRLGGALGEVGGQVVLHLRYGEIWGRYGEICGRYGEI